ncbi:hypothetical protein ACJJTC_010669, partial [Scirpophaga incertulas]
MLRTAAMDGSCLSVSGIVKCSNCNVVINEVLAFICNKIDVMDEESIRRICVSAFSESDIRNAKELLISSISTTKRNKTRKNKGKTAREIEDIVSLLKQTDPEDVPVFVARDLQKLPPVLFDHVDVTRLLKDVVKLKSDLDRVSEEYATLKQVNDLRIELESLKNTSIINNFQRNVNTKRGGASLTSFEYDSGLMGLSPVCNSGMIMSRQKPIQSPAKKQVIFSDEGTSKNFSCPSSNGFCTDPVTYTTDRSMPTDTITNNQSPAPAAVVRECTVEASLHTTGTNGTQITDSNKKKSFLEIVTQTEEGFKSRPVDDGYILVQKRRLRNRFLGKTGNAVVDTSSNFKAADIKVPIYIYNVSKETTVCDIKQYIKTKTNLDINLEKMNMRMKKDYNAFKILVPKIKVDMFLSDSFWPDGVNYRRFVEFNRSSLKNDYRHIDKSKLI